MFAFDSKDRRKTQTNADVKSEHGFLLLRVTDGKPMNAFVLCR